MTEHASAFRPSICKSRPGRQRCIPLPALAQQSLGGGRELPRAPLQERPLGEEKAANERGQETRGNEELEPVLQREEGTRPGRGRQIA